ncbi:MAG: hypothetical protein ACI392_03895 [Paludibacteraceae bacterium]
MQLIMHTDNNFATVFLHVEFAEKVEVFDSPNGEIMTSVQNNISEEDYVMFDLLHKPDNMYYVIAYSGLTDRVLAIGWIPQNTNIGIYSAAYGDLHLNAIY